MNKRNLFLLSCIISATFAFSCTEQKESPKKEDAKIEKTKTDYPKGSLFIIGGGSRPAEMVQTIATESGIDSDGYGVILPMSSVEPDTAIFYSTRQFKKLGFNNVYGLQFTEGEILNQAKVDSIRNAKLVYISGGDQSKFMAVVAGTDIEKAIHDAYANGSMIAGTSAGAAVMSEIMITGNELKHPEYSSTFRNIEVDNIETAEGLGMLKTAIIDQHFVKRSRHNRLLSAVIEYPDMMSIGIDESTAIYIKNGTAKVEGISQVLVFTNPKKDKLVQGDLLGAKGLQLDIYLPGESFDIAH